MQKDRGPHSSRFFRAFQLFSTKLEDLLKAGVYSSLRKKNKLRGVHSCLGAVDQIGAFPSFPSVPLFLHP